MRARRNRRIRLHDTVEPGWQERDAPLEITLGHENYIEMIGFIGVDIDTDEAMIVVANRDQANEIQGVIDDYGSIIAVTPWNRYMRPM